MTARNEVFLRFSSGSGMAAGLVRSVTWSWCAHVSLMMRLNTVIDATPLNGVSIRTVDDTLSDRVEYYCIMNHTTAFTDGFLDKLITEANKYLGAPYDYLGCIGIGIHRDWKEPGHWFCSEFIEHIFEQAGSYLLRTEHLDRITPRDLLLSPYINACTRDYVDKQLSSR